MGLVMKMGDELGDWLVQGSVLMLALELVGERATKLEKGSASKSARLSG